MWRGAVHWTATTIGRRGKCRRSHANWQLPGSRDRGRAGLRSPSMLKVTKLAALVRMCSKVRENVPLGAMLRRPGVICYFEQVGPANHDAASATIGVSTLDSPTADDLPPRVWNSTSGPPFT